MNLAIIILLIILLIFFLYGIIVITTSIYNDRYYSLISKLPKTKPIETNINILDKPLKDFYINSSHNSYISGIQNGSYIYLDQLKIVLDLGVRCIELDIHDIDDKPVVLHGSEDIYVTNSLNVLDCFNEINKYGFQNSDPLILMLEIGTKNNKCISILKEYIIQCFGDKLLSKDFKFNSVPQKKFIDEPIKNLLNKVIIVTTFHHNNILYDVIDDHENQVLNIENIDSRALTLRNNNNMTRIYPTAGIAQSLSYNMEFNDLFKNKHNMVIMNFQTYDKILYDYLTFFKDYSFVLQK